MVDGARKNVAAIIKNFKNFKDFKDFKISFSEGEEGSSLCCIRGGDAGCLESTWRDVMEFEYYEGGGDEGGGDEGGGDEGRGDEGRDEEGGGRHSLVGGFQGFAFDPPFGQGARIGSGAEKKERKRTRRVCRTMGGVDETEEEEVVVEANSSPDP